jgi:hypothetical protein
MFLPYFVKIKEGLLDEKQNKTKRIVNSVAESEPQRAGTIL